MRISKHIAIGMEACGSKVIRIIKPTDTSAYQMQWHGHYRFENPKWYDVELENGRVIKDKDLYQVISPEGHISLEAYQ